MKPDSKFRWPNLRAWYKLRAGAQAIEQWNEGCGQWVNGVVLYQSNTVDITQIDFKTTDQSCCISILSILPAKQEKTPYTACNWLVKRLIQFKKEKKKLYLQNLVWHLPYLALYHLHGMDAFTPREPSLSSTTAKALRMSEHRNKSVRLSKSPTRRSSSCGVGGREVRIREYEWVSACVCVRANDYRIGFVPLLRRP